MLIEAGLDDFEDFSPLPVGVYNFIVKEPLEVQASAGEVNDIGGKLYTFIIRPEVMGGDHAGKKVRRQLTNKTKATRYFLRTFLEKIGVEVSRGGGFSTEAVLGKQFEAAVRERKYKDRETGDEKVATDFDYNSIVAI